MIYYWREEATPARSQFSISSISFFLVRKKSKFQDQSRQKRAFFFQCANKNLLNRTSSRRRGGGWENQQHSFFWSMTPILYNIGLTLGDVFRWFFVMVCVEFNDAIGPQKFLSIKILLLLPGDRPLWNRLKHGWS